MIQFPDMDLDSITHVIQASLTPIFLLSGVATLLGTFTTRLARISDQVNALTASAAAIAPGDASYRSRRLMHLRRRSHVLDWAVILAALAGACTCGTVLTLFLGAIRSRATAAVLFILFGLAVCLTIGALMAFLMEMLLAGRGIRAEVARQEGPARLRHPGRETNL